jgi:hypothetical protein
MLVSYHEMTAPYHSPEHRNLGEEGSTVEMVVHGRSMGEVLFSLRCLESALRHFLYDVYDVGQSALAATDLAVFSVGDVLLCNPLTNADSLRQLIEKYNAAVTAASQASLSVDLALCDLQGDLEDGRVWGNNRQVLLRLVNFSPPANGLVTCIYDQLIDDDWLDTQAGRLSDALDKVAIAAQTVHAQHSSWQHRL